MLNGAKQRIAWVDYAKGICIILVVMMHTTLGVEKATGITTWLHAFIDWARPFRMPDFFMISGLFLASRIDRPWRTYLDSKVLHFAYFYVLWMGLQLLSKSYGIYIDHGLHGLMQSFALALIEPFGTLWFIYLLAIFFALTKALRRVPPLVVVAIAALLEAWHPLTGFTVIDEFAARYVYFFIGYWLASRIFVFAARVDDQRPIFIAAGLLVWGFANFQMVRMGYALLPGFSLAMGIIGAAAVISSGVLLSKFRMAEPIRYCGANSIVIYLAFFLFMAGGRSLLLRAIPNFDLGLSSLAVTYFGVVGPLVLFWLTRNTKLSFLFKRPDWARLANYGAGWHSATHVSNIAKQLHAEPR